MGSDMDLDEFRRLVKITQSPFLLFRAALRMPAVRVPTVLFRPRAYYQWMKMWRALPVLDWIRGAELFRDSEFRSASEYYRRGLAKHPEHVASDCARLDLAYCLFRMGEVKQALTLLKSIADEGQSIRDAALLLAQLQINCGQFYSAAATMRAALARYPDDAACEIGYCWSVMLSRHPGVNLDQVRFRLRDLRSRVALTDSRSVIIDSALAYYEIRYGDSEFGEQLLSRVLASGAAPFEAVLLRGERLLEDGRLTQARDQLERAMKLLPTDPRPALLLARYYLEPGDTYEAHYAFQLAQEACKKSAWEHPDTLAVLVDCYEALGEEEAAGVIGSRLRALTTARQLVVDGFDVVEEQLSKLRQTKISNA